MHIRPPASIRLPAGRFKISCPFCPFCPYCPLYGVVSVALNGSCALVVFLLNSCFGAKTRISTKTKPKDNQSKTKTRHGKNDREADKRDNTDKTDSSFGKGGAVTLCLFKACKKLRLIIQILNQLKINFYGKIRTGHFRLL